MENTSTVTKTALVRFIEEHNGAKVEAVCGSRLEVSSIWVDRDCTAHRVSEQIDATWTAARLWLGY